MKMSSPYCRSEMRPEYLAEFEAAGIPPYSQVAFPVETPTLLAEPARTRKVILDRPTQDSGDGVAENLAAIVAGMAMLFAVALALPMAFLFGVISANRRANRRSRRSIW